jgi:hypothetical protein
MEIIKQILYSYECDDATGVVTWRYLWYAFPFQVCSTTMYIGVLTNIIPKGRLQQALDCSLVIVMMGGVTAWIYPAAAFHTSYVFICNQTMIHHGVMIVVGVVLMVTRLDLTHKIFFLYGLPVYLFTVVIAIVMDLCFYHFYSKTEEFDMFYISPYWPTQLPAIEALRTKLYGIFLTIYILVSSLYGYLLFLGGFIFMLVFKKIRKYYYSRKNKDDLKESCLLDDFYFILCYFIVVLLEMDENETVVMEEANFYEKSINDDYNLGGQGV